MSDPPVNFLIPFRSHVRGVRVACAIAPRRVALRRAEKFAAVAMVTPVLPTGWAEAACVTNLTPRRYRCAPDSHLRFVPGSCQR